MRFIPAVFGIAFFGIGLTVLGFLWLTPFDQFGSPPIFFRIFGSFIAMVFVAVGGATAYGAIFAKSSPLMPSIDDLRTKLAQAASTAQRSAPDSPIGGYVCPHCGAPLQARTEVSPSGDVKCPFCSAWFNVRQAKT
jgi:hypothetical protein